jgi:hypothetical protein
MNGGCGEDRERLFQSHGLLIYDGTKSWRFCNPYSPITSNNPYAAGDDDYIANNVMADLMRRRRS